MVSQLTEDEALKLAVVFEEVGAYRYKSNKDMESKAHSPERVSGGWEEDFSLGEDDDTDYADRPDILYNVPIAD